MTEETSGGTPPSEPTPPSPAPPPATPSDQRSEAREGAQQPAPPPPPPPAPAAPPYRAPAPPPRRTSPWAWGCGIALGGCLLFTVLMLVIGIAGIAALGKSGGTATVDSAPIALIRVEGAIVSGQSTFSMFGGSATGSENVVRQIERAMENGSVKAILLRVNSPGGSAAGSQEIYNAIARAKKKGLKVVVSMADVAASGGYYVSANADRIYANPATFTGSIGVIFMHENMKGLFAKLGIESETIKSGKLKDMGAPTGPLTPEARQVMTGIIMQVYEQFLSAVAEGRKMAPEAVKKLADGRVYTGEQAKQIGLVDELGGMQEALQGAADLAGIRGKPRYTDYGEEGVLRWLLGAQAKAVRSQPTVTVTGGMLYDEYAAQLVPGPWRAEGGE